MEHKLRKIFGDDLINDSKIDMAKLIDQGYTIKSIMAVIKQKNEQRLEVIGFKPGQIPQVLALPNIIDEQAVDSWSPPLSQDEIDYIKRLFKANSLKAEQPRGRVVDVFDPVTCRSYRVTVGPGNLVEATSLPFKFEGKAIKAKSQETGKVSYFKPLKTSTGYVLEFPSNHFAFEVYLPVIVQAVFG